MINIGAYKAGSNKDIDYAIQKHDEIINFLLQNTDERFDFDTEISMLKEIFND